MNYEVTRDIVSDLWPLYEVGEASTDSRNLVDAFLAQDDIFAREMRLGRNLRDVMPPGGLAPDTERQLLVEARRTARLKLMVFGGSIALFGMMFLVALVALLFRM